MILDKIKSSKRDVPRRTVIYGIHGVGKCFGKGTPILMRDGTVLPVEQVSVGDQVMGPDSIPRSVTSITTGKSDLYRIVPKKGDPFIVNGDHILSLKHSGGIHDGEITNISVRDFIDRGSGWKSRKMLWRAAVDFEPQVYKHELDPYLLGVWLGDGSSTYTSITTPDPEIVEYINQSAISIGGGLRVKKIADKGKACTYAISPPNSGGKGNALLNLLRQVDVIGNKHIPMMFKTASKKDRLELLAGLIDTDGYLGNSVYEITQKSKRLSDDIAFVARSVGLAAHQKVRRKKCFNNGKVGTYYQLTICGDIGIIPCKVPRRQIGIRKLQKDPLRVGFSIEPIGHGSYFGFSVDGDHLFLLGDFTVTHNSSWAANWPSPVFIPTEDGLAHIDVPAFPLARSLSDVREAVLGLTSENEQHDFKTVVIDSADWLEKLIWDAVCVKAGKDHVSDIGYGKGYAESATIMQKILMSLNMCRNRGMHVVLIAHAAITRFESPEGESYDRYAPKLHRESAAVLQEWADEVLFASYKVFTATKNEGFGRERAVGIGTGERIIRTTERPSHNAKNRLGLPDEMSLSFSEYEKFLSNGVSSNG